MGKLLACVAIIAALTACDRGDLKKEWMQRERRVKELDQGMSRLAQQIKKEVGPPECARSSECRLVGLGAKVCDKYRDFLVYSTSHTDEGKLLPLVGEFNQLADEQYNLNLSVLTCGKPMAQVSCIDGGCQPLDAGAVLNPRERAPGAPAGNKTPR